MEQSVSDGVLADLTVLELGSVLACPAVGVFLAELGARVIKLENTTTRGDVTRTWKLSGEDPAGDISGYFSCINWGKQSLALDLTRPEARDILHRLAAQSDVVLVNYKPGDAEKLGADYATLSRLNPRLVYGHITGYGLDSPRAGYDAIIQAESGFTGMNGEPDGPPVKLPVALMDLLAAHQLKEGILLALYRRERSGRGAYLDVSLMQAGIASLANQAANWLVGRKIPGRMGSDHPSIVPYGTIFGTADGKEIVLAVGADRQFERLCAVLGRPDLSADERFRTNHARVKHREALKDLLRPLVAAQPRDPLLARLEAEFVPAGAVNDMAEVFATPQAQSMLLHGTIDGATPIAGFRTAVFRAHDDEVYRSPLAPPPRYGEHTRRILRDLLGLSGPQIDNLARAGIVHCSDT
jgi:crotonobetainyl-CoA:carnitine CoA-transferase CaiB-like acyl-CoA transferase